MISHDGICMLLDELLLRPAALRPLFLLTLRRPSRGRQYLSWYGLECRLRDGHALHSMLKLLHLLHHLLHLNHLSHLPVLHRGLWLGIYFGCSLYIFDLLVDSSRLSGSQRDSSDCDSRLLFATDQLSTRHRRLTTTYQRFASHIFNDLSLLPQPGFLAAWLAYF